MKRKHAVRALIVVALLWAADRGLAGLVLSDDLFLGRPVAPFDPPLFCSSQRQALESVERTLASGQGDEGKFDPDLGWCNKPESGHGEFKYDWAGARIGISRLPTTKSAGVLRAVTIGCSMTHGEEVGASSSWSARVDALADDLEVANLGVAAYGIDQALLRLRRDGWPLQPDEVWLGVLPQAGLRITTRFRPLLDHWSMDVAFKPRFVLDERNELMLLPNPARELAAVPALLHDQSRFLRETGDRDPWIENARKAYALRGSSWLHGSFCGRLGLTFMEKRGRKVESCFEASTDFGALFTAIVRQISEECKPRGATFRLLVLPGRDDLESMKKSGKGYWEDWCASMRKAGIEIIDFSATLQARADLDALFMPGGHYSEEGSELVARELFSRLSPRD